MSLLTSRLIIGASAHWLIGECKSDSRTRGTVSHVHRLMLGTTLMEKNSLWRFGRFIIIDSSTNDNRNHEVGTYCNDIPYIES